MAEHTLQAETNAEPAHREPTDRGHVGRSRRGFLGLATGAAAFAAVMKSASAQPVRVKGDVDPSALLEKLVDRITFGATPEELTLARQLGYQGYLEYQLNH